MKDEQWVNLITAFGKFAMMCVMFAMMFETFAMMCAMMYIMRAMMCVMCVMMFETFAMMCAMMYIMRAMMCVMCVMMFETFAMMCAMMYVMFFTMWFLYDNVCHVGHNVCHVCPEFAMFGMMLVTIAMLSMFSTVTSYAISTVFFLCRSIRYAKHLHPPPDVEFVWRLRSLSETALPGIAHTAGSDHRFSIYWLSGVGLISDWMVGALYLLWRLSQST